MLSIEECRKILRNKVEKNYTDEEIKQVRQFLYELAELVKEQIEFEEQLNASKNGNGSDHVKSIQR